VDSEVFQTIYTVCSYHCTLVGGVWTVLKRRTVRPAWLLWRLVAARRLRRPTLRRAAVVQRESQNAVENSAPNATLSAQPPHLKPSSTVAPAATGDDDDVGGDRPQPHLDAAPVLQVRATDCSTAADDRA